MKEKKEEIDESKSFKLSRGKTSRIAWMLLTALFLAVYLSDPYYSIIEPLISQDYGALVVPFLCIIFFPYHWIRLFAQSVREREKRTLKVSFLLLILLGLIALGVNTWTKNLVQPAEATDSVSKILAEVMEEISGPCEILDKEDTFTSSVLNNKAELKIRAIQLDECYKHQVEYINDEKKVADTKALMLKKMEEPDISNAVKEEILKGMEETLANPDTSEEYKRVTENYKKNDVEFTKNYRDLVAFLARDSVNMQYENEQFLFEKDSSITEFNRLMSDLNTTLEDYSKYSEELRAYMYEKYGDTEFTNRILNQIGVE